jgi:hypothetical protein
MRDIVLFTIYGFIIAIVLLVAFIAYSLLNDEVQTMPELGATEKALYDSLDSDMPEAWDYSFLFIIVAFAIGIMIFSWMLQSQPVMFIIFFFIIMFCSVVAGFLSNAFEEIIEKGILGTAITNFPIMHHIMQNYLVYTMVLGFLMVFVFFAKPNEAGY